MAIPHQTQREGNDVLFDLLLRKAQDAVRRVEQLDRDIAAYVQKARSKYGETALASVKLGGDTPFLDAVADRNRNIQMAIMYSNMALLYK